MLKTSIDFYNVKTPTECNRCTLHLHPGSCCISLALISIQERVFCLGHLALLFKAVCEYCVRSCSLHYIHFMQRTFRKLVMLLSSGCHYFPLSCDCRIIPLFKVLRLWPHL